MQLRWYQDEAVESSFDFIRNNKGGHPLIELPTGTGKALCVAGIIQRALARWPSTRVVMLTHSKELVRQNTDKLKALWPEAPIGIYSAGLDRKELGNPVTMAGIDSVAKKAHLFGVVNIVIIDEAHMVDWEKSKSRYRLFIEGLMKVNPKLRVVGLTATPWRAKLGHIAEPSEDGDDKARLFTGVSYSRIGVDDFHQFVGEGFLAPLHPLRTELTLDVSGVGTTAGDFNQGELQDAVDREYLTRAAIDESLGLAADCKQWLTFCTGVEHVEHTAQYLNEAGVSAVTVHSKQDSRTNDRNIRAYLNGKVRALCNMGVLTTGFDAPETSYIMMLRPTKSTTLHIQMLGRGTRPHPSKEFTLVGDFAGNAKRLGPINDPIIPRRKGKGGGTAPVKECDFCGCINHASAAKCQKCGELFPPPKPKITRFADSTKLMKESDDGNPVVEVFRVDGISYTLHKKFGKPDMVKVTYTCGFRMFNEFVCVEHEGYARVKADQWWRSRFGGNAPQSVSEALETIHLAKPATHIRVWSNKKYPEIMAHCFEGTAFGSIDPLHPDADPTAVSTPRIALGSDPWSLRPQGVELILPGSEDFEDIIPF